MEEHEIGSGDAIRPHLRKMAVSAPVETTCRLTTVTKKTALVSYFRTWFIDVMCEMYSGTKLTNYIKLCPCSARKLGRMVVMGRLYGDMRRRSEAKVSDVQQPNAEAQWATVSGTGSRN